MKCPKCGYNSFESFDACKKCAHDLITHKTTFGLQPVVLQREERLAMAAELASLEAAPEAAPEPMKEQQSEDIFSFDLPGNEQTEAPELTATGMEIPDSSQTETFPADDILKAFSFAEEPAETTSTAGTSDIFADELETTRDQTAVDPLFPDAIQTFADQTTGNEEYDLTNFTWDDTPEPSPSNPAKPVDNFDSLFGETHKPDEK